jgi:uncharacterized protein (TIGR03089 family)
MTVFDLLLERSRLDPARPLVTFLRLEDGIIAERMELSAASAANGVAKIAGLLRDELDAQPGDVLAAHLPLHWQTSLWIGAAAATGVTLQPGVHPVGGIGVGVVETLENIDGADDRLAVSRESFGMPISQPLPAGVMDAATAQRAHPDVFIPYAPVPDSATALTLGQNSFTHAEVYALAEEIVQRLNLVAQSRLLVLDREWAIESVDSWLALLAVPLIAQSSIVLVATDGAGLTPAVESTIASSEGVTHRV